MTANNAQTIILASESEARPTNIEQVLKDFFMEHIDIEAGILGARIRHKDGTPPGIQVFIDPHYDCAQDHPLPKTYGGLDVTTKIDPISMMHVAHGYSVSACHTVLKKRRKRRE
jgi:hypothetical protein